MITIQSAIDPHTAGLLPGPSAQAAAAAGVRAAGVSDATIGETTAGGHHPSAADHGAIIDGSTMDGDVGDAITPAGVGGVTIQKETRSQRFSRRVRRGNEEAVVEVERMKVR